MNYEKLETELKKMFKYIKKDGDTIYLSNNSNFWGYVVNNTEAYTYGDRDEREVISEFNDVYLNLLAIICEYYEKEILTREDIRTIGKSNNTDEIAKICGKYLSSSYISENLVSADKGVLIQDKVNYQKSEKFYEFYYSRNDMFIKLGTSFQNVGSFYCEALELLIKKKIFDENILKLVDVTQITDEDYLKLFGIFVRNSVPEIERIDTSKKLS